MHTKSLEDTCWGVSYEEKEEWKVAINEMCGTLSLAKIPNLSESQYNIFTENHFVFIPSYKGEITDKVFEIQLNKLKRIKDFELRGEYIKQNILPNCKGNKELEYFSLLYAILSSSYSEAKNHYNRVKELAEELSKESGDSGYLYVSQLSLFNSASHYQDPGELYNDMIYMPEDRTTFYVVSRFYLSNYHMSKGDYPTALDFNIGGAGTFLKYPV